MPDYQSMWLIIFPQELSCVPGWSCRIHVQDLPRGTANAFSDIPENTLAQKAGLIFGRNSELQGMGTGLPATGAQMWNSLPGAVSW